MGGRGEGGEGEGGGGRGRVEGARWHTSRGWGRVRSCPARTQATLDFVRPSGLERRPQKKQETTIRETGRICKKTVVWCTGAVIPCAVRFFVYTCHSKNRQHSDIYTRPPIYKRHDVYHTLMYVSLLLVVSLGAHPEREVCSKRYPSTHLHTSLRGMGETWGD